MRPHHLRLAGIGPYPQLVEIDFDELSALGLYLIVGPTGAGKTTIFDAITFALYGEVAGQRPETGLASDHAHRTQPFVELDFSHRGAHYRVFRRPAIDNKPAKPADIRFIEFTDEHYVGEVKAITGTTAVTKAVTELIGLDADQFLRVMLLPQNEFQQFLLADSKEKEKLLRALFGTRLFERMALEMADSAKDMAKRAEAKKRELDELRFHIRQTVETLEEKGLVADVPDPDECFDEVLRAITAAAKASKQERAAAEKRSTDAAAKFATGEVGATRFDAHVELVDLTKAAKADAPAVKKASTRLELHERANRAVSAIDARDSAREAEADARTRVEQARAELRRALGARVKAPVVQPLRDAGSTAAPAELTSLLASAIAAVDTAAKSFEQASAAAREVERLEHEAIGHEAAAVDAETAMETLTPQLAETKVQLTAAKKLAKGLAELQQRTSDLDHLLVAADVDGATAVLVKAQKTLDSARLWFTKHDEALAAARSAHTKHLAGELAATLADGDECPVCGSVEHPKKAKLTGDRDLGTLEVARDEAKDARTVAEEAWKRAAEEVNAASAAAATLPAVAEQESLRDRFEAAKDASEQLDELEEQVTDLQTAIDEAKVSAATSRTAAGKGRARASELTAQAERLVRDASAVVALKDLDDVREMLDETAECIDELTEATGQLSGLVGKAQQAAEGLATALAREGFSREPEVAAGLLDEDTLDALGECVQVDVARSERMLELRAVVGEAPVPKHRPDLDMLEEAAEIAAAALEQAGDRATTLANAVETLERRGEALTTLGSDVASLVERAIRAKHIADVVNRGEGEILGLERWVQRAVFEEVCQVATEQIRALSHGRYVLTLDATGQPQRKRAAGLDLFVTDSHTGRTRRVQSLSGGEQFLTSLALALALAEVVQNRSGGIELSTLFIDEGFGSLDGDTLDTAVEVLRSLQDNGRTVGLISHVDAMKQELPVGIQVTPSQTGSSITCPSLAA